MQQYVFISYSYKNKDEVMRTVSRLQQLDFNVWYDGSTETGIVFSQDSKLRIEDCSYFLAFISDDYFASGGCMDEFNYARDSGKPCLSVYLNEMQIPGALNSIPSVHKYAYQNELDFYLKIIETNGINVCRAHTVNAPDKPTSSVPESSVRRIPIASAFINAPGNVQQFGDFLYDPNGTKKAVAALICSILSLMLKGNPFPALILSIAAIVLSSMSKKDGNNGSIRKFANITGIVCLIISIPGVIISLLIKQAVSGIDEIGSRGLNWIDYIFEYIKSLLF